MEEGERAEQSNSSSAAGRQSDFSDLQPENARRSICFSFETGSNVTERSKRQKEKHPRESTSTEEGMQTDNNDEQSENASASIRNSRESDSNVNISSDLH
jgi:hypothetical protein